MSIRGVWQLKTFVLHFCDKSKSSEATKNFVNNGGLFEFAKLHPHIKFICQLRRNQNPYVQGEFMNGRNMTQSLKNKTEKEVEQILYEIRSQCGEKSKKIKSNKSSNPSIQGVWNDEIFRKYSNIGPKIEQE